MTSDDDACILVTCRFFDPVSETEGQWGYEVVCFNRDHGDRKCPEEHELFRRPPVSRAPGE